MASTAIVLPPEEERLETVALFILLRLEVVSVAGKMTPKMQKFVDEYLVALNAPQAVQDIAKRRLTRSAFQI